MKSINELLLGSFQIDAKFFEIPLKNILTSDLMVSLDPFVQAYIKRTLVNLLANLAISNPDFASLDKVDMLSASILHLIKIGKEQIKNYDELIGRIASWKKEMGLCEKMAENTAAEKLAKNERSTALKLEKLELQKLFYPCSVEILKRGGWQDPQNILAPEMLKPWLTKVAKENLPELLFAIYSDTLVLKSLTDEEKGKLKNPERIEQFSQGIMRKATPSIKTFLDENSYMLAEKMNQKLAHSDLDVREEAVLGGQLKDVVSAENYTMKKLWAGVENFTTNLVTLALSRLSLAYLGPDQGDSLSNAIMQLRTMVDAQNVDPALVDKITQYKNQTKEIKDLDKKLAKLKEEAVLAESSSEPNPSLFERIKKLSQERREKFLELHIAEHARRNPAISEDKQMTLVSDVLKAQRLIQDVEKLKAQPLKSIMQKSALLDYLVEYKSLATSEYSEIKTNLNLLQQKLTNASEEQQKGLKSQIDELQKRLFIKGKEIEKNELLKYGGQEVGNDLLTVDLLLNALKKMEEGKLLELEQTVPLQKQYQELLDQFKPLSRELLQTIGYKGLGDLPVPFFLQPPLWQSLEEAILPDMFLDMYRFAWVPPEDLIDAHTTIKQNLDPEQLDNLNELVLGSSHVSSDKLKEMLGKQDSSLPKLLANVFAEQKINGMDQNWFKNFLEKLGTEKSEMNNRLWDLITVFLYNRIDSITANLSIDGGSEANLLQHMLSKLFEPIATYIKANQKVIDQAISAYDALPENERKEGKQKLAKKIFGALINDVFAKTGLDKPHTYGIAYAGPTIITSLKDTLEGFCFDLCHDARFPRINLAESKKALNLLIAHEGGIKPEEINEFSKVIVGGFSALGVKIKEMIETQIHDAGLGPEIAKSIVKALGGSIEDDKAVAWYSEGVEDMVYHPQVKELIVDLPELVQAIILRKLVLLAQKNPIPGESPLKSLPVKINDAILDGINKHRKALQQAVQAAYVKNPKISEKELQKELKKESLKVVDTLFKAIEIDSSKDLMPFTETLWSNFGKDVVADYFAKTYLETTKIARSQNGEKLQQVLVKELKIGQHEAWRLRIQLDEAMNAFGIKIEQMILNKIGKTPDSDERREFVTNTAKMLGEKIGKGSPAKEKMTEWLASIVAGMTNSYQVDQLLSEVPEMIHAVILKKLVDLSKSSSNVVLVLLDTLNRHRSHLNQVVQDNPELSDKDLQKVLGNATTKIVTELFKTLDIKPKDDLPVPFADQLWENAGKDVVSDMLAKMYLDSTRVYRHATTDQLKKAIPDEKLRTQVRNGFRAFGGVIRDTAKIQLGLMPNKDEKIGNDWNTAKQGEWVLRESKSKPRQFSLIQKQKGKTRKESPTIPIEAEVTVEEMQQAIANYKSSQFANTIGNKLIEKMGLEGSPVEKLATWMTGSIKKTVNSIQVQQLMSDIPDIVETIVLKKMMQLAQVQGMPIQPKEGETPLKYLPANIVIMILNGIEGRREQLKQAVKDIIKANPNISDKELQQQLKPEFLSMVETLFAQLKMDPQEDLPVPFAEEIWNNVGKDAVAEMFAITYVDMSKNIREKQMHKANLDARFRNKIEPGHAHTRLVEVTKSKYRDSKGLEVEGYTGFAMKYIKNMMVYNTPGIENALEAANRMLRAQGDSETVYYLQTNQDAIKKWLIDSNLKEIAKSNVSGVEGTLFPAAKSDIRAAMLKIFDNFTGNIEKLQKNDPDKTLNFVLKLMDLLTTHLQLVNEVTHKQGKSFMYEADPVLMEKEFAARGELHPDMPGYQWRQAVIQTQKQIDVLEKDVKGLEGEAKEAAEYKLEAAKSSLKDLQKEAELKLKSGTYKKMASYFLQMAGYHGPEDLTEVPQEAQEMLWDALNNSLGPDLIQTMFGKAFDTKMLNGYLLKLLKIINEKIGASFKDELPKTGELTEVLVADPEQLDAEAAKTIERQGKCRQLIEALAAIMPKSDLADLTKLDIVGDLATSQAESILKESLKEWSMLNIIEEALVSGAASLPKNKLPETLEEARIAEVEAKQEADRVPGQIKNQAVLAVKNVRNSIWKYFKLKWNELQRTMDRWIAAHDILGIFSAIKQGLDEIFHVIFFDIIGTAVVLILSVPYNWIAYFYRKFKIQRDIETARKNIVIPKIHQNFGLHGLDALMEAFPPSA
jgi:hypothetical protein